MNEQLETLDKCPACGVYQSYAVYLEKVKDYTVSKNDYTIVQCKQCQFVYTNPRPTEAEAYKYYISEDYISHSNTRKDIISRIYARVRSYNIKFKEQTAFKAIGRKGKLLDYGCGTGEFLNYTKQQGWKSVGIEPGTDARAMAISNYGLEVFEESAIDSLEEGTFDVITLWHVLEHVYPLHQRIKKFHKLLKPDGALIIAVPNRTTYEEKQFGEYWAAYDVPRHIYHFDKKTMYDVLDTNGFIIVNIKGMAFDAYYISLLSEKYKKSKIGIWGYIRAFFTGLESNFWGGSLDWKKRNHSSLIYIAKKK